MSRIYEALQKAESDRKLDRSELDQVLAEPEPLRPVMVQTAVAEVEEAGPVVAVVEPTREAYEPEIVRTGLTFSNVARYAWTPDVDRLPALQERGPGVEQFRSLRSRIYELRDIKPLKSILISSGLPQEGKSFVAMNLAISLSRHKSSKVLLIDGDMRRYTLHQMLGTEAHPGLADYLSGKATMVEVMQRMAESSEGTKGVVANLANLTFIPGGNGGDKAADLSGNPRFAELVEAVSPYFDWIVVDSSPVLPVSDAVNLARACDGVLLVARSGVTKYPVAQRAQSELKASNILGFVLNAVANPPQVGSYYGYDAETE